MINTQIASYLVAPGSVTWLFLCRPAHGVPHRPAGRWRWALGAHAPRLAAARAAGDMTLLRHAGLGPAHRGAAGRALPIRPVTFATPLGSHAVVPPRRAARRRRGRIASGWRLRNCGRDMVQKRPGRACVASFATQAMNVALNCRCWRTQTTALSIQAWAYQCALWLLSRAGAPGSSSPGPAGAGWPRLPVGASALLAVFLAWAAPLRHRLAGCDAHSVQRAGLLALLLCVNIPLFRRAVACGLKLRSAAAPVSSER